MKSHMPRWPTRSRDPLVNIFATAAVLTIGIVLLPVSFLLVIPIAVLFAIFGAIRWYYYRPPPYSNPAIADAVEQHAIAANFPDSRDFAEAYAQRLIEAWHPQLPVPTVLAAMVEIAVSIYEIEGFNNPLPPIPPDPIDQGRWRDEMRIHALGSRLDHSHQLTMSARVMAAAKFVASLS